MLSRFSGRFFFKYKEYNIVVGSGFLQVETKKK